MKAPKHSIIAITLIFFLGCSGHKPALLSSTDQVKDACEVFAKKQEEFSRKSKRDARKYKPKFSASTEKKNMKAQPNELDLFTPQPVVTRQFIHEIKNQSSVEQSISVEANIENDLLSSTQPSPETGALQPVQNNTLKKEKGKDQPEKIKFTSSLKSLLIIGLAGLVSIGLLKSSEKKLMHVSRWGMAHPYATRGIIAGAHGVVGTGALVLGHSLYDQGVMIPEIAHAASFGLFTTSAALYPNSYINSFPNFTYFRRKAHDVALFTTGAMMMVSVGNQYEITVNPNQISNTIYSIPVSQEKHISVVKNDFSAKKTQDKKKERSKADKVGLIVLASIGFGILGIIVAGLSCSLSCSGNAGAAALVLFGGGALVVFGLVATIRKINGKGKKTKQPVEKVSD